MVIANMFLGIMAVIIGALAQKYKDERDRARDALQFLVEEQVEAGED